MRISDWSSDVCSSDLPLRQSPRLPHKLPGYLFNYQTDSVSRRFVLRAGVLARPPGVVRRITAPSSPPHVVLPLWIRSEERRVGKRVSVSVDLGGRRIINIKKHTKIDTQQKQPIYK